VNPGGREGLKLDKFVKETYKDLGRKLRGERIKERKYSEVEQKYLLILSLREKAIFSEKVVSKYSRRCLAQ